MVIDALFANNGTYDIFCNNTCRSTQPNVLIGPDTISEQDAVVRTVL